MTHRNPALLANAIATIDRFSGGRAALGIGIGWSATEHRAYGIPFAPVGERFDALEEWLPCIRKLLDGETVTFDGRHVHLHEARVAVGRAQERIPIWVGGVGERRTIPLAARFADGWNSPAGLTYAEVEHKIGVVRAECRAIGRDPSSIRCASNALLAWDPARAADVSSASPASALVGSVRDVAAGIESYFDAGADQVNLSYLPEWGPEGIDRAGEVLERLR